MTKNVIFFWGDDPHRPSSNYTGVSNINKSGLKQVKLTAQWQQVLFEFDYSEKVENFSIPYDGYYKLEVWGAQGGDANGKTHKTVGGYGSYSVGLYNAIKDATIYIVVGGKGISYKSFDIVEQNGKGFNGGGRNAHQASANNYIAAGGGGATHIATVSGLLKDLESFKGALINNSYYQSEKILVVAGGGGGAHSNEETSTTDITHQNLWSDGGMAGGIKGSFGSRSYFPHEDVDAGGKQTKGGESSDYGSTGGLYGANGIESAAGFGVGCFPLNTMYGTCLKIAGGGGFFGGGCTIHGSGGGGGGSGYIGSSNLVSGGGITKHMTCYSCTTSSDPETRTYSNTTMPTSTPTSDVARIGNGFVRITYLGATI